MKTLCELAEKGSLDAFEACLKTGTHSAPDRFLAIRIALLWDQPEKVRLLLDAGADPFEMNEDKDQLLSHAAIGGNPSLVRLMLSLGCDPRHQNIHGRTALHEAARSGKVEAIGVLMEAGASPDVRDTRNRTPLSEALSHNHPEAAKELIHRGADPSVCTSEREQTVLMLAAAGGFSDIVGILLERGADPEKRDSDGRTALMYAATSGNHGVVKMLVDAGADVRAADRQGLDAFHWTSPLSPETASFLLERSSLSPGKASRALLKAASDGHVEAMRALLAGKARIQPAEEGGESALEKAVFSRSPEALNLLLRDRSVQIDYRSGKLLRTALIAAARTGDAGRVRALLENGADPAVADVYGRNAMQYAASFAHTDVLTILEKHGADVALRDRQERTLLHLAIGDTESASRVESRNDTVRWLLSRNVNPNSKDQSGVTPLMLAAFFAYPEIVRLLIEYGADVNAKDREGRTALYHAACHGTDYGYNDRYTRPKSRKSDKAEPVIMELLESGADPGLPGTLVAAEKWRWRGAVSLLRKYGAKR